MTGHRTLDDLSHHELATLLRELLLGGQLIDRAGMPQVIPHGIETMRDIAIDEWMGASPIYSKRTQRLLGFEGDTVETAFKNIQLDVGAPPEFLDFRFEVIDDHHGEFHLDHCGALMDVEPMGDDYVRTMCHDIEDPTFEATGWAANPRMRMRPIHRPPRTPADRQPHCAWRVFVDPDAEPLPEPAPLARIAATEAARLPLASHPATGDGATDYAGPLDPDLRLSRFSTATLRDLIDEVCLQGHLLVLSFLAAVEERLGPEAAVEAGWKQGTGVAGVVATRLRDALGLGTDAVGLATAFELHPAFHPRSYVSWAVEVAGDAVRLELRDCVARHERGRASWITMLADGHDRMLSAIAAGIDPHWAVRRDGPSRWVAERGDVALPEPDEVTLTKFSTGAAFRFRRPV